MCGARCPSVANALRQFPRCLPTTLLLARFLHGELTGCVAWCWLGVWYFTNYHLMLWLHESFLTFQEFGDQYTQDRNMVREWLTYSVCNSEHIQKILHESLCTKKSSKEVTAAQLRTCYSKHPARISLPSKVTFLLCFGFFFKWNATSPTMWNKETRLAIVMQTWSTYSHCYSCFEHAALQGVSRHILCTHFAGHFLPLRFICT